MNHDRRITHPADPLLIELCEQLAQMSSTLRGPGGWPGEQLALCGRYGVFEWFISPELGGQGWSAADVVRGYLQLSAACLTTTFVITQRTGACRRIALADSPAARDRVVHCSRCGLGSDVPGVGFDDEGVCSTPQKETRPPLVLFSLSGSGPVNASRTRALR